MKSFYLLIICCYMSLSSAANKEEVSGSTQELNSAKRNGMYHEIDVILNQRSMYDVSREQRPLYCDTRPERESLFRDRAYNRNPAQLVRPWKVMMQAYKREQEEKTSIAIDQ